MAPENPRRYQVVLSPSARKQIHDLSRSLQERIAPRITALGENPRPHGVQKLQGEGKLFRIRIGDYRVVYTIQDEQLVVLVVRVAHRKDVYRP